MTQLHTSSRYRKPALTRYGTFRDLTRVGPIGGSDIGSVFGIAGCEPTDRDPDFRCSSAAGSR